MNRSRKKHFVIMVHDREREAIDRLAEMERLPSSTFARVYLLKEAERRGLLEKNHNGAAEAITGNRGAAVVTVQA